jgi:hypothetical protein
MDYQGENPFVDNNGGQAPPNLPPKQDYTSPPPSQQQYTQPPPNVNRNNRPADPSLMGRAERLRTKEEDLNRREAVLDEREKILWDREKNLDTRIPNWPRCKPLVYHNIDEDIPPPEQKPGLQRHVRLAYWSWLYGVFPAFIWSCIALLAKLCVRPKGASFADFFLSLIYLIFLLPLFFGTYRLLYRSARKNKAYLYVFFMIFFVFQILVEIFFAIGVEGTGACGLINAIVTFKKNLAAGALIFIGFAVWALLIAFHIFLFFRTIKFFSLAGGAKAAKEGATKDALEEAKNHPDLVKAAAKQGVKVAAENPELVAQGVRNMS